MLGVYQGSSATSRNHFMRSVLPRRLLQPSSVFLPTLPVAANGIPLELGVSRLKVETVITSYVHDAAKNDPRWECLNDQRNLWLTDDVKQLNAMMFPP